VLGDRMTIALPAVSLTIVKVPLSPDKDSGLHYASSSRRQDKEKERRKIGLRPSPGA